MKNIFSFLVFILIICSVSWAQGDCYTDFLSAGNNFIARSNYPAAIEQFKAAQECAKTETQRTEISQAINNAQNGYILAINAAKDKALAAEQEAKSAKKQTEIALQKTEKAKRDAEKLIEAYRLAFLADQEMANENKDDGLTLSFIAFNAIGEDTIPKLKRSFGDAVFLNYKETLKAEPEMLTGGIFSPSGEYILTRTKDNKAYVWERGGTLVDILENHEAPILDMKFSPDGRQIVTVSADSTANIWQFGKQSRSASQKEISLKGHKAAISGVEYSPDGLWILTWARDNTARLWNNGGVEISKLDGHQGVILDAKFSQNGKNILTRSADRTVGIWDEFGTLINRNIKHSKHIYTADFSPDDTHIITSSADGKVGIWDLKGNSVAEIDHAGDLVPIADFHPNGKSFITITQGGKITHAKTNGDIIRSFNTKHRKWVVDGGFSPAGDRIYTLSNDTTIAFWDLYGNSLAMMDEHTSKIVHTEFSAEGRYFLSSSVDGTVKLWDFKGDVVMNQIGPKESLVTAIFSPDSKQILTVYEDGKTLLTPTTDEVYEQLLREGKLTLSEAKINKYKIKTAALSQTGSASSETIRTPTSAAPIATTSNYKIRLVSLRNPRYFNPNKVNRLGKIESEKNGKFTVIYLGEINSLSNARELLPKVKSAGFPDAYIVVSEGDKLKRVR